MNFDRRRTAVALALVYGLFAAVFLTSPMPQYAVGIVLGVLLVFGALVLYIGVRFGEYRGSRS